MSITLYVEGGGRKPLNTKCRRGFGRFIERAGMIGRVRVVACGSRGDAYQRFKNHSMGGTAMLLVDAEGAVTGQDPWQYLQISDGWARPASSTVAQCHLMVQIMESWFLADVDALESFYGRGFRRQALPGNPSIEQVPKQDVLGGLAQATSGTAKGSYRKSSESFEILAELDPVKVRNASPFADRLFRAL